MNVAFYGAPIALAAAPLLMTALLLLSAASLLLLGWACLSTERYPSSLVRRAYVLVRTDVRPDHDPGAICRLAAGLPSSTPSRAPPDLRCRRVGFSRRRVSPLGG